MIELKEPFIDLWKDKDVFFEVKMLQGEVFRELETRRTLRFFVEDKSYFLKWHQGTTIKEVVKNLISFRLPVLGADREWKAIHRLKELGVDTMTGVGFGEKGWNPITKTSFIITEDLISTISLEDYTADWLINPPTRELKNTLIHRVATMVRKMHQGGVNHRDCYICHFLLHIPFSDVNQLKLSVIDLHRAQMRAHTPLRWRNKDLIGLYFSSKNIGLTSRDIFRFLKWYFSLSLRDIFSQEEKLLIEAQKKAEKIMQRTLRKSL